MLAREAFIAFCAALSLHGPYNVIAAKRPHKTRTALGL